MRNESRTNLIIACVALIGSLGGAGIGSWLTGNYLLKATKAQVNKDISILSSQNAQKDMEKLREKAEIFLTSAHDVIVWFENHDTFNVNEARQQIRKLERTAFAFAPYGNPKLTSLTIAVPLTLREVVDKSDKDKSTQNIKKVSDAISEWTKEYYAQMAKFEAQTMPDKWKTDTLGAALGRLLIEE